MQSHEFAERLKKTAEFLLSKPDIRLGWRDGYQPVAFVSFMSEKEAFISAARAMGAGDKRYDQYDLTFIPAGAPLLRFTVARNAVCRKVQEEKWECEALLSNEEVEQIGQPTLAASSVPDSTGDDIPF
jgi:hypothetical protein